ncbi:MAG: winged helix-turn-helix transcriptional regulator [Hyphomicrobiales bacterium]|nr:winged helix-turn-helix transcriptional regulator [Hyphomicrobiales bacterium]
MPLTLHIQDAAQLTKKVTKAARLLNALANESRLAILCELVEGERSVGSFVKAVGLTQSALSQHLAKLRAAGIVNTRREAQTIYYRLTSEPASIVMKTLADIYCNKIGSNANAGQIHRCRIAEKAANRRRYRAD